MKQTNLFLLLLVVWALPLGVWAQTVRDYDYYYGRGNELLCKDSAKLALSMFESALLLNPKSPDAYIGRGRAKIGYYLAQEGMDDYDTAILVAPRREKIKYFEAKESLLFSPSLKPFYTEKDRLDLYNQAVALFPDSARVYSDRSYYFLLQDMLYDALADAKKSVRICPSPKGYGDLATAMMRLNNYPDKKIGDLYDKCVQEFPNDAKSYYQRGSYYYYKLLYKGSLTNNLSKDTLDELGKAIGDFKKAISINPKESVYYELLTNSKTKIKKYTEKDILGDFNTWQAECPTEKGMYWQRASYHASISKWKEAVLDLDSALKYAVAIPYFLLLRADYKDRSGDYKPEEIIKDLDAAKVLKEETGFGLDDQTYDRLRAKYGGQ